MFPTGSTKVFPVIGQPIDQVRSPQVMTELFAAKNANAIVIPLEVTDDHLAQTYEVLHASPSIGGILVTVPHKQRSFKLCEAVTDRASFLGAVNVVRRTVRGWYGDNTDGVGYLNALEHEGFSVAGRKVLLVGCGGAGSAIALELLARGAALLAIHDIDQDRRNRLIDVLNTTYPGKIAPGSTDPTGYDLVANATPMGMRAEDQFPVEVGKLDSGQFVACVVTKPAVPALIQEARRRGCGTMTGTQMFDAQAENIAEFLLST